MTLQAAIRAFSTSHLTPTNAWYTWRPINPARLPTGLVLAPGNQFSQNVALKLGLSTHYAAATTDARKIELTEYYIATWGGVRSNGRVKIECYSLDAIPTLIALGSVGIASWSKALCIRAPSQYSIYDARVAIALNAIQISAGVTCPVFFPLLKSQNGLIQRGNVLMRTFAQTAHWAQVPQPLFYQEYNAALSAVANAQAVGQYVIEMLLFAKAADLVHSAFPNV